MMMMLVDEHWMAGVSRVLHGIECGEEAVR